MNLLWFHLMPYTDLPEDFRDKHPSVWVDIDSRLFDPQLAHTLYNDFIDELEYAAELGFDGVCVNEHHANGYGLMPSPNLISAALARGTKNAALCVMGNSLALYNPPLRIAEEMAMIDCISGGRLIAGFPLGTPMDTTFAYGQNPSTLREKYDEARRLILRAWSEPDPFAFNGRFTKLRYVNIWPRPIQRPHPPIWIPGGGALETWAMCARESYVFAALSYFGFEASRSVLGGYWQEMERHGRSRNPYQAGYLQFVGVAETHAEAMKLYREPAEYFYGRCLRVDPRYTSPPGYTTESSVRAAATRPMQGVAQFQDRAPDFEQILERGYIVAGEPDEVAARLRQIATDLNIGQLMLLLQFGNMGKPLARYNTRLFAERVMPQIADLFENQWEDHWWPQRLKKQAATAVA